MPFTCEKCQEVFYSETEYREHIFFEQFNENLKESLKLQINVFKCIEWTLRLLNINYLSQQKGIPFDEAMIEHDRQWGVLNEYFKKLISLETNA